MSEHLTLIVDEEAKRKEVVRRHHVRTEHKVRRQKQRKCFWTEPWGHKYVNVVGSECWAECVGCGKRKWNGGDY